MTVIETNRPEETFALGENIGKRARAGEIYTLTGDLGAGKTVLAKGVAAGLGIDEHVSSPTFTILQEYRGGRLPLYHFDVYRIEDPEEMFEVGLADYLHGEGVCLIEWAEQIAELLPAETIDIVLTRDPSRGDDYRRIEIRSMEAGRAAAERERA